MARWLFDSNGQPIAFINGNNVFSQQGQFIGKLEGNEIWNGQYIGEITQDDRLLRNTSKGSSSRGMPGLPGSPGLPGLPGSKGSIGMPGSFSDVEL